MNGWNGTIEWLLFTAFIVVVLYAWFTFNAEHPENAIIWHTDRHKAHQHVIVYIMNTSIPSFDMFRPFTNRRRLFIIIFTSNTCSHAPHTHMYAHATENGNYTCAQRPCIRSCKRIDEFSLLKGLTTSQLLSCT